jgi:glycosyltransferase involved in cell wall biosynthesis
MNKKYKVCAIVGDFENRKKGLTHYIFENINKSIFDIFYICCPARDFGRWGSLYNKKFECFGFKTYLIPRNALLKRMISIGRILNYEKPDMIFSAATGLEPFLLKIMKGIPWIDSIHGMPRSLNLLALRKGKIRKSGLRSSLVKFKIRNRADYIIAVSKAVRDELIAVGISEEKVKIIYNGVDIEYIRRRSSEEIEESHIFDRNKTILSVGRLSPEKGHKCLIDAFNIIKDRTNAKLVIIGWGPEEKYLKDSVEHYSLKDRIFFLGFKENPFKYMVKSNFLVLPSVSEAFPSVLMEAAICGLPVLATDCGGTKEILNIIGHGLLVPRQDVIKLADSMFRMLNDPELSSRFLNDVFINAIRFDIKNTAYEYQKLWLSTLNGRKV